MTPPYLAPRAPSPFDPTKFGFSGSAPVAPDFSQYAMPEASPLPPAGASQQYAPPVPPMDMSRFAAPAAVPMGMPSALPAPAAAPVLPFSGQPQGPNPVAMPSVFTGQGGQSRTTDFGPNSVTVLTGDAARAYDRRTGYGPDALPSAGSVGGSPAVLPSRVAAPQPMAIPSGFGLKGFDSAPGQLKGFGPGDGAPRMSTSDWATINAGRDKNRIAQLGVRYAGSGDAFTPQGMETRSRMESTLLREQGETARQKASAESAFAKEQRERGYKSEDEGAAFIRGLMKETGEADPAAAIAAIREGRVTKLEGEKASAAKTKLETDRLLTDADYLSKNKETREQTFQREQAERQQAFQVETEKRKSGTPQAAATLKKTEAEAAKAGAGAAELDLDAEGQPITTVRNGIAYEKRGGRWHGVGRAQESIFGPGGGTPATPAPAPTTPVFTPEVGKVYTQGGKRYKYDGKTYTEVK